jgi:hypothetical protein
MTATIYRPAAPAVSILDEIVCISFQQRFAACKAVERTIWDHGMQMCTTPAERAAWQAQYRSHLEQLCTAWGYGDWARAAIRSSSSTA